MAATENEPLSGKIKFIQHHKPGLMSGDYEVTVKQEVSADGKITENASFECARLFSVAGPRFQLAPQDVYTVFPPPGSLGEHSNVLPHVILNRSTLPWEREIWNGDVPEGSSAPWLALLVFHQHEVEGGLVSQPRVLGLEELVTEPPEPKEPKTWDLDENLQETQAEPAHTTWFPACEMHKSQHPKDRVAVIDVRADLLGAILPTPADLEYLAHVRQRETLSVAVVVANRLPQPNGTTTVHLVSLEDRYESPGAFEFPARDESGKPDFVRLVSLKSWNFSCVKPEHTFKGILKALDRDTLRLPASAAKGVNPAAEPRLNQGHVPLRHYLRKGDKTISWYHGPLLPGKSLERLSELPHTSDQLLRYDPDQHVFDTAYAAAWKLGRMLALEDKRFSVALTNWKRVCAQRLHRGLQAVADGHLYAEEVSSLAPPPEVGAWFDDLNRLKRVPFNYLVPDTRMLPEESIRFFQADPLWLDCLLDGAFSLGRVIELDRRQDSLHKIADNRYPSMSGFLLRSQAVSGWPGMLVDAYPKPSDPLPLRIERLTDNVLLCLFQGPLQGVDIHLKPETLHFGLKRVEGGFAKELKDEQGKEFSPTRLARLSEASWRTGPGAGELGHQTLDVKEVAGQVAASNSARFALQMIEGTPLVRFSGSGEGERDGQKVR